MASSRYKAECNERRQIVAGSSHCVVFVTLTACGCQYVCFNRSTHLLQHNPYTNMLCSSGFSPAEKDEYEQLKGYRAKQQFRDMLAQKANCVCAPHNHH